MGPPLLDLSGPQSIQAPRSDAYVMTDMTQPFCFIHIEKTAGITLHNMLHRDFFNYISPSPKHCDNMDRAYMDSLRRYFPFRVNGIGGHMVNGIDEYRFSASDPIIRFAFLRDPVERFISHFNWQSLVMGKDRTFEAFVADEHFANFQCHRLSKRRSFEAAKEVLDRLDFVGETARFDMSSLCLSKLLDGMSPLYERSNVKDYKGEGLSVKTLDPAMLDKVRAANAEDQRLFDYAQANIFPRQAETFGVSEADVATFRAQNEGYRFPWTTLKKRRASNAVLKLMIQPFLKAPPPLSTPRPTLA